MPINFGPVEGIQLQSPGGFHPSSASFVSPTGGVGIDFTTIQAALDANPVAGHAVFCFPGTYDRDTINYTANNQCVVGMGLTSQQLVTNVRQICDFGAFTSCRMVNLKLVGTFATVIDMITGSGSLGTRFCHFEVQAPGLVPLAGVPTVINTTGTVKCRKGSIVYHNGAVSAGQLKHAIYLGAGCDVELRTVIIKVTGAGASAANMVVFGESTGVANINHCSVDVTDDATTFAAGAAIINGEGDSEFTYNSLHISNAAGNAFGLFMDSNGNQLNFRSVFNHIHVLAPAANAWSHFTAAEATIALVIQLDDIIAAQGIAQGAGSVVTHCYSPADGDWELSGELEVGGAATFDSTIACGALTSTGSLKCDFLAEITTGNDFAALGPQTSMRRARTSAAAPSAVQSGDALGELQVWGYDSAAPAYVQSSSILTEAAENYAGTRGSRMKFSVVDVGDGAITEYLRLDGTGETIDLMKEVDAQADITLANGVDLLCAVEFESGLFSSVDPGGDAYIQKLNQYEVGGAVALVTTRYNGTFGAPTKLLSGDPLYLAQYRGYRTGGAGVGAADYIYAREDYNNPGSLGTARSFYVTGVGSGAISEYLRLDGGGETIDLRKAVDAQHDITLANGVDLLNAVSGGSNLFSNAKPGGNAYLNYFQQYHDELAITAGATHHGYLGIDHAQVTDDCAHYQLGSSVNAFKAVAAGKTDSGYIIGQRFSAFRNNVASWDDNGTLATLYGQHIQYGHYNADADTPQTTTAYGLKINPYRKTGNVGTMIDIDLSAESVGGTIGAGYGIRQVNTKQNEFAGKLLANNGVTLGNGDDLLCAAAGNSDLFSAAVPGGDAFLQGSYFASKIRTTPEGGLAIALTNKTGGASVQGQVVDLDTANNNAVTTTPINAVNPIGVIYNAGIADAAEVWVVVSGIADILIDAGGSTAGDWLGASATAGSAVASNSPPAAPTHFEEMGHCLETRVGAGLAKGVLHFN